MKQINIVSGVEVKSVCFVYDSHLEPLAKELMYGGEIAQIIPAMPPFLFESVVDRLATTHRDDIRQEFNHSASWMLALDERDQGVQIVQFWSDRTK